MLVFFCYLRRKNPGIRGCSVFFQINIVNSIRQIDRQEQGEIEKERAKEGAKEIYVYREREPDRQIDKDRDTRKN